MAIELIVTGDTGKDAAIELNNFIATLIGLNGAAVKTTPASALAPAAVAETKAPAAPAATTAASTAAPATTKKATTTKPKKGEAVETPPDDNSDIEISLEGCRTIIKRIAASAGEDNVDAGIKYSLEIIQGFGVAKVTDLPEDKFEDFIDKCKEVLANGGAPRKSTDKLGDIF